MRILHVATTVPTSQRDRRPMFVVDLAAEIAALGHHVDILAPFALGGPTRHEIRGVSIERYKYWWPSDSQALFEPGGVLPGLKARPSQIFQIPPAVIAQCFAVRRIARFYDLIHAHWILPSGLAAALSGRPFVLTAHGSDLLSLRTRFLIALKKWVAQRALCVTVNSEAMRWEAGALSKTLDPLVIPMGVRGTKPNARTVAQLRATYGHPLVLFAGRLADEKGPDVLARAMEFLPEWTAVFVGDGPLREQLCRFRCTGWLDAQSVTDHLAAADVVAVPSRREGQGLIALEALHVGTPVVGTAVGGLPENATIVVPPNDPGSLATSIRQALGARVDVPTWTMAQAAKAMDRLYSRVNTVSSGFRDEG